MYDSRVLLIVSALNIVILPADMLQSGNGMNLWQVSVYNVETGIGSENFRDDNSIVGLIVFQQGGHYPWQSEGTSVKCMDKPVLLFPFSLKRHFSLLAWNDSKFETELTSSHLFWAADHTSKS